MDEKIERVPRARIIGHLAKWDRRGASRASERMRMDNCALLTLPDLMRKLGTCRFLPTRAMNYLPKPLASGKDASEAYRQCGAPDKNADVHFGRLMVNDSISKRIAELKALKRGRASCRETSCANF